MATYTFTIELPSDAEPGTGLGTILIDSLAPRDVWDRVVIRASHIKGLMRQSLKDIAGPLGWGEALEAHVFGRPDDNRPGMEAIFRLTDAVASDVTPLSFVSRTGIDLETGSADDKSLRTTESIPVGTVFTGALHTATAHDSVEDAAWRLALLAISGVGAGRTRGSGNCVVTLGGETRNLGTLLKVLHQRQATWTGMSEQTAPTAEAITLSNASVVLRLVFEAQTPVCCPEVADKTNVISSGFRVPASAVQGAILNRLNAINPNLATEVFNSQHFRPWPLLPSWAPSSEKDTCPESLPVAIRVGLTQRVSKFATGPMLAPEEIADSALALHASGTEDAANSAEGDASEEMPRPPMKAADGVWLKAASGVKLWKASDMPRVITGHGVHNRQLTQAEQTLQANTPEAEALSTRNLYTVDAMAPMVWQGLLVLPKDAQAALMQSVEADPIVAFGKSRSVRGIGRLRAEIAEETPPEWVAPPDTTHTVLVVQSPLHLPRQPDEAPQQLEQEFRALVGDWAEHHQLITKADRNQIRVWAALGVHFGWSRHDASGHDGNAGRQPARRVVQPGSVIAFPSRLDDTRLAEAIQAGIGDERQRGFGAVSVHPGMPVGFDKPTTVALPLEGSTQQKEAIARVLNMRKQADRLPSPSQLRAVQQRLRPNQPEIALAYLKRQTERTSPIWFIWEQVYDDMIALITHYPAPVASQALEVLADLAIYDQEKGTE